MRNSIAICLAAVAAAACSSPAGNNAAESNGANATAANMSTPAPAAAPAAANEAGNNQAAGNGSNSFHPIPTGPQPNRTANYRASGTEPSWTLVIAGGELTYTTPGGVIGADAPEPSSLRNGFEFRTALLTARFADRPCTEASGRIVPYTVRVTAEGRSVNGCGE